MNKNYLENELQLKLYLRIENNNVKNLKLESSVSKLG